jgi:hypothetical protein
MILFEVEARKATLIECASDLCGTEFVTLTPDRPHVCSQCLKYGPPDAELFGDSDA